MGLKNTQAVLLGIFEERGCKNGEFKRLYEDIKVGSFVSKDDYDIEDDLEEALGDEEMTVELVKEKNGKALSIKSGEDEWRYTEVVDHYDLPELLHKVQGMLRHQSKEKVINWIKSNALLIYSSKKGGYLSDEEIEKEANRTFNPKSDPKGKNFESKGKIVNISNQYWIVNESIGGNYSLVSPSGEPITMSKASLREYKDLSGSKILKSLFESNAREYSGKTYYISGVSVLSEKIFLLDENNKMYEQKLSRFINNSVPVYESEEEEMEEIYLTEVEESYGMGVVAILGDLELRFYSDDFSSEEVLSDVSKALEEGEDLEEYVYDNYIVYYDSSEGYIDWEFSPVCNTDNEEDRAELTDLEV